MSKIVPMTPQGYNVLKQEIKQLKSIDRPRVIEAISEARSHGDLKENAEYHAAREEQGFLEARIKDIDAKLSRAQIIDVTKITNHGKIIFGSTVQLLNLDTDDKIVYQIVGEDEANIKKHKLSVISPIARNLIGKQQGEEINIKTPSGSVDYEILDVQYI